MHLFGFITKQYKLEGCIVLNEHNTVFARSGSLYATGVSLGSLESSTQTVSRSLQSFLQGSLSDRPTDRPTDHATCSATIVKRTVEKPNSVIVYDANGISIVAADFARLTR